MKKLKYVLILILSMSSLTSCFDDETGLDANAEGPNVVTFDRIVDNITGVAVAGGAEYTFLKKVKIVGPTVTELKNDITVTVEVADGTTADGTMYHINNPTFTLTANDHYLGLLSITMTTLGNEPPEPGSPEEAAYVAPVLNLSFTVDGDPNVIASGKIGQFQLNFTAPNPMAGDYSAHIIYRHPSVGTYPDNIASDEVNDKSLLGLSGTRTESSWFAVWEGYLSWITLNEDNTLGYKVTSDWSYDVQLGDPNRPDLISHFDPDTGVIYLYYHYEGSGGTRIFWEVWTPKS